MWKWRSLDPWRDFEVDTDTVATTSSTAVAGAGASPGAGAITSPGFGAGPGPGTSTPLDPTSNSTPGLSPPRKSVNKDTDKDTAEGGSIATGVAGS